jgi:ATP-dependent DNA helicase DinG
MYEVFYMTNKYVVIDLETTGNSPKRGDKIIQFAAVVIENGKITEKFSSLINPQQKIPAFIEELTGLTDQMVRDAPVFSEIAVKVEKLLEDAYFVAHNVLFDLSFLQDELNSAGYDGFYGSVIDTVELARILFPTADSYKLNDLALQEGLRHDRPHQADSDAYVTAELLLNLLSQLGNLPLTTLRQLSRLSEGLKSDIHMLLDDLILKKEKRIEEIEPDLEIYRGFALRKRTAKDENSIEADNAYPFSEMEKERMLKQVFPAYEKREGQFIMMDTVFESLKNHTHALIEAGTGVGKSLAYLIPSATFAKRTGKPVIISTYTTQLQQQLMSKDVPLLKKMFPFSINTVLLKGREHYLSLAKFELSLSEEDDNYDTTLTKMQILVWLTKTETGDVDELNLSSGGHIFWNKVKHDHSELTLGKLWLNFDFYHKARGGAKGADLIITNHSLLLSDMVSKRDILPDYDFVIIDEGHHFEKASGKFFGLTIDFLSTRLLFSQLGTYEQKQLFYRIEKRMEKCQTTEDSIHTFEANRLISELNFGMDEFFQMIALFTRSKMKRKNQSFYRISRKLSKDECSKEWSALLSEAERFTFLLKDTANFLSDRLMTIKNGSNNILEESNGIIEDISSVRDGLLELREMIRKVFLSPLDNYVRWIEIDLRAVQNSTTVYANPVDVSQYLQNHFFKKKKSIIVTSATLTVNRSFQYIMKELGMDPNNCQQKVIPSPFCYENQVQLIIPRDLPEINQVSVDEYVVAISEHIISIAEATKGRMLILFTSHEMLKHTYDMIRDSGFLNDFAIMAQGITSGSRTRLTRNFQRFDKAILLGTSSFWEGVDIPGEDLSCLIIVRLPFSPPDEPFTEAKCDLINQKGGNPFSEYSLPEAVLRFKQGFGRLIRTQDDRGAIIVFDRRIVTTQYGRAFLQSIPKVPVKEQGITEIVATIQNWL